MTPRRSLLLFLPVVSLSLAACGGPPEGDVAVVKTDAAELSISEAEYKRFFGAALSQAQQTSVKETTPLVAPDFKACIAEKKKEIPDDSQRKKTSDADLKKQCEEQYEQTRNTAMQQLINLNWIKAEADRRGVEFRKAEVARELNNIITQQFQGQEGYKNFLTQSGLNRDDVELNVIAQLGQTKIVADLQEQTGEPTDAEVRRYFEEKRETYVQPETRDMRLIKAKNEADAKAAKAAIEAGESWTAVAKKYSTDAATKDQGGKVLATTADQQPPEFGGTVFKAKNGELLGPIKTSLGYYVVKVQNINAEKQPVFAELEEQLKQALAQENQQTAINRFRTLFLARWAARTTCGGEYDDLVACGGEAGAPAQEEAATKPTPPPGAGIPQFAPKMPVDPAAQQIDPTQQQVQQAPAAG
ncbi:MAG: peptidyl-prolyl cis-trans isomerase [Solirubrobacteraceae bacterium]|nr:peptidyl-prolyl cis-trans isomerase [Solirubrobacteraceae bacterium]